MATPVPAIAAPETNPRYLLRLLLVFAAVFAWSAIRPHDYFTWFLETVPAMVGLVILAATYRRFPFTPLVYTLICLHAIILCVGGHYTYAEVPLGNWVRDLVHGARNNYDKVGHFAQGAVPAMIAREVLLRRTPIRKKGWVFFLVTCICLAISATYELFEWGMAEITGGAADAFLGTQGYVWDTQTDMLMALIGAVISQLVLAKWHDRQLKS
jgi:putative membrane protein